MKLFSFLKNKHDNKEHILIIINSLVNKMDNINDGNKNCKDILLKQIKNTFENSSYAFEDLQESEFERRAYEIIYDFSFDLLCSGQFHIYRGVLNEMTESTHLMHICKSCLEWAYKNQIISQNEKSEQLEILKENIQNVG